MIFLGATAICTDVLKSSYGDAITKIDIMNSYVDDIYASTNPVHDNELVWDVSTVFWAPFKGNLLAGNVLIPINHITSIRIKVREYGETLWKTIYEYKIKTKEDFNFANTYYYLKGNKTKYEFAIVPVLNKTESKYITNTVVSDFDGCFLCTQGKQYHAFINLSVEVTTNKEKNYITTLGRQKPFAISNGLSQYDTLSVSASFVPMNGCELDFEQAAAYRREINKFLTATDAMILKNGENRWLVSVGSPITQSVDGHPDNVIYNLEFTEIGDCESTTDLYNAGLSDIDLEGV